MQTSKSSDEKTVVLIRRRVMLILLLLFVVILIVSGMEKFDEYKEREKEMDMKNVNIRVENGKGIVTLNGQDVYYSSGFRDTEKAFDLYGNLISAGSEEECQRLIAKVR